MTAVDVVDAPVETPAADALVTASSLVRRYGAFEAVKGIDFAVRRGEAFGFLGPNGAGKSSTMRMIASTSVPTSGTLRVLGRNPATDGPTIRARLGVVPQDDTLDHELSVRENLLVYGRYFGLPRKVIAERTGELLEFAQLTDKADERVERLSGGMRRRLTIARSLINRPDIILLDEPTTGLDPQARHVLWDRLHHLRDSGVTLIITTHYMDEAEQLCDRLVIMDGGRIVARGAPRDLIRTHVTREVLEVRHEREPGPDGAKLLAFALDEAAPLSERIDELPGRTLVYTDDGDAAAEAVHRAGVAVHQLYVRRATLEDVFLHLTGRTLVD